MLMEHYPSSWSKVIEIWYNESKYFKYGEWPSTDDDIETDHYTQVICILPHIHTAGYICL